MTKSEGIILLENFLRGKSSKEELLELHQWIKTPEHVDVVSEWMASNWNEVADQTHCEMDADAVLKNIMDVIEKDGKNQSYKDSKEPKNKIKRLPAWVRGVAAVLLPFIFLCVGYLMNGFFNEQKQGATLQTIVPRGQKAQLVMADGTKVWLNSESVITYPSSFGDHTREVSLKGEAFFEVTKDANRPFFVKTKGMNVKVLGTAFNVSNYEDEEWLETTLVHGSVQMEIPLPNSSRNKKIILKPNQKISFKRNSSLLNLYNVDTEGVTAWREGKLVFRSENFERLARKLERWYDVKIHFLDEDLKMYRYTGTFDRETVEQAVNALRLTSPFKYTMEKRDIYIQKIESDK